MDPNEDMDIIDSISANQLGIPPQPQEPQAKPAKQDPTPQEVATSNIAPTDKAKDPFEFFDAGNGKVYTPEQLRGIASRYSDLNYRHQTEVAPIKGSVKFLNELVSKTREQGVELDDDGLSNLLQTAIAAYTKNPTLGNQQQPQNQSLEREDEPVARQTSSSNNLEEMMAEWEQANAISLPPMYKDAISRTGSLEAKIGELTNLVQQLASTNEATAKTAEGHLNEAKQMHSDVGKQRLINNLANIQNKYQFADDQEQDFMNFVQSRGYDIYELMDLSLADTLASDFKAIKEGPDLQRFRDMARKRQAFTGTINPTNGGQSSAQPAAQPSSEADTDLAGLTDAVMARKNMT